MADSKHVNERLVVLLLLGIMAINYPILALFSNRPYWLGIPSLYFYLFTCWGVFIVLLAMILGKSSSRKAGKKAEQSGGTD